MNIAKLEIILFFLCQFIISNPFKKNLLGETGVNDAVVIKNRDWDGYEKGAGAYYIAYSPYATGYSKVTSYIILPYSLDTRGGKRNAYISLGVLGINGFIDLGIMNSGDGWKPYYNKNGNFLSFPQYTASSNVKIIGIEIDVTSNRRINFAISFRDINYNILNSFSIVLDASDILEYENGKVKNRFYRFASLVNVSGYDNQNDHTYMINGTFSKLCIVVNNQAKEWGISSNYIDVAWLVSSRRIEFGHNADHESFSIRHYEN